ncbi:MAG: sensor histidine kinase [Planctomycetota bacterium]
MSLRLRILLLIATVNVAVLTLVVFLGLESAAGLELVPSSALNEALRYAQARHPERFDRHATSFLAAVEGPPEDVRVVTYAPAEMKAAADRAGEELLRLHAVGEPVYRLDRGGLTVVGTGAGVRNAFHVRFNDRARREAVGPLRSIYVLLAAGTLLLIGATYLILRALVLRPIEQLSAAAEAVAAGQRAPKVPRPPRDSEVARLIDNFNRMAAEVHEYQQHLEEKVTDALSRVTAAEKRLVVAQRLSATGTLAAGFAHEINNPLGGIMNALRKLREGDLDEQRRDEYYELVDDGLHRIRTIVDRILHFTPGRAEPAAIDATEVCRQAAALAGHRAELRGVEVEVEGEQAVPLVGDAQELTQAVLNLLLNAVDAIPEGRGGRVTVAARSEGGEVFLEVNDDGVGMDPETVRRCVDYFYSTKPEGEGTGLGMAIVQHIVTDHGGSLDIASERGKGTTVRMRLPGESLP